MVGPSGAGYFYPSQYPLAELANFAALTTQLMNVTDMNGPIVAFVPCCCISLPREC